MQHQGSQSPRAMSNAVSAARAGIEFASGRYAGQQAGSSAVTYFYEHGQKPVPKMPSGQSENWYNGWRQGYNETLAAAGVPS